MLTQPLDFFLSCCFFLIVSLSSRVLNYFYKIVTALKSNSSKELQIFAQTGIASISLQSD